MKHRHPPHPSAPIPPREDAIRVLAYRLYEQRGRAAGHDLADWYAAVAASAPAGANLAEPLSIDS